MLVEAATDWRRAMKLDVILPAGGRISGEFATAAGVEVKALIELGGRSVLQGTIEALRGTERVRRVVVVGPQEVHEHSSAEAADAVLPEGGDSGPANILKGLDWLRDQGSSADRVLIVTTDLPFLTPDVITTFVDSCPSEADVCAPLVSREAFEARFPASGKSLTHYVALADGLWTMGCGFLVNPEAIRANRDRIEQAFAVRRSQIGMARLLGLGFLLRHLMHRLTVPHIEERCGQILGCSASAVHDSRPELAYDLDYVQEYRYALASVGGKR